MAGNGTGRALLPWVSFVWTVGIAVVGGMLSGVTAYYGGREQIRSEIRTEVAALRQEMRQEYAAELRGYLPLTNYWQMREEMRSGMNAIERKLDRIESRLK